MFGFGPFSDAAFGAQKLAPDTTSTLASVNASIINAAITASGDAEFPAILGVSAVFSTPSIDFDAKANITSSNVSASTVLDNVTTSGKATHTTTAVPATFTVNLPDIEGLAFTTLDTQSILDVAAKGELVTNYTVTVANSGSGNKYYLNGIEAPALTLVRGTTYTFDLSDSSNSGHPFAFKSGTLSYTDGVTTTGTAGSSGASVTFAVPTDAPGTGLRYYCTVHGNSMGNTITTGTYLPSLEVDAQATTSPTSLAATLNTTIPSITGLAFVTTSSILANILQNLETPIGESFDFNSIANSYSRGRTVYILAPTVRGTYTVYVPFENRKVVLAPSTAALTDAARFVFIKPEDRRVFIEPVRVDRVVYITN
jgi:hypothetical protein